MRRRRLAQAHADFHMLPASSASTAGGVFVGDDQGRRGKAVSMQPVFIDQDDRHRGLRGERMRDLAVC
jgi:hypothetical protein